jgi:Protein of unknown function (DUF1360)
VKLTARALGIAAPERVAPFDLALVGLATHKIARILSKDAVTYPLRAPCTVYDEPSGDAELSEHPRKGSGAQHAVGKSSRARSASRSGLPGSLPLARAFFFSLRSSSRASVPWAFCWPLDDVLVQVLPGSQTEGEPPLRQQLHGRFLRDNRRVIPK